MRKLAVLYILIFLINTGMAIDKIPLSFPFKLNAGIKVDSAERVLYSQGIEMQGVFSVKCKLDFGDLPIAFVSLDYTDSTGKPGDDIIGDSCTLSSIYFISENTEDMEKQLFRLKMLRDFVIETFYCSTDEDNLRFIKYGHDLMDQKIFEFTGEKTSLTVDSRYDQNNGFSIFILFEDIATHNKYIKNEMTKIKEKRAKSREKMYPPGD